MRNGFLLYILFCRFICRFGWINYFYLILNHEKAINNRNECNYNLKLIYSQLNDLMCSIFFNRWFHQRKSILLLFFLVSLYPSLPAQEKPVLKQQISLDGVDEVISSSRQNMFLVHSKNGYTLIDQASKIQLGTLPLNIGNYAIPGRGKMYLWGDSTFIVSTGTALLMADVIGGYWDTLCNMVKFPELIINFIPLPWDENILLIATKTYPVTKNGTVNFFNINNRNEAEYDDSKNCRLLLFDIRSRQLLASKMSAYAITAFSNTTSDHSLLAGTFDGDIINIDSQLNTILVVHAFDFAVHSLVQQQSYIVAVPHIAPKYIGGSGGGSLFCFNILTGKKKIITLPKEQPVVRNSYGINPASSNGIIRLLCYPQQNCLLVNYGFTRLLKIALPSLDTISYGVKANAVNFYCFNKDSTQLLAVTAEYPGIFTLSGDLSMYDLDRQKFQTSFNKPALQLEYSGLIKIFDARGNYHFVGHQKRDYFNDDTLLIYSSNKTTPTLFICHGGKFVVNENDGSLLLTSFGHGWYGMMHLENLSKDKYLFNLSARKLTPDSLHPEIFTLQFSSNKFTEQEIPYGVSSITTLANNNKVITGYYPKKENTFSWIRVMNKDDKLIFSVPDFVSDSHSDFCKVSPSGKCMGYTYPKKGHDILEVRDINTGKLIFMRSFPSSKALAWFTFDKNKEVLWYSQHNVKADLSTEIFKVNLDSSLIKEIFCFEAPGFLSFEIDMEHDLIASENYDELFLHRLSNRILLWQLKPSTTFFKIHQQPNGFAFASDYDFHVLTKEMNYLYFTSFTGFSPVEIANDKLYKGDKEAINNLAFVLHRKGYSPSDYDMYFNRPDSIGWMSGSTDTAYNWLVNKAVEKRMRYQPVVNLDTLLSNSPRFSITNKNSLPDIVNASKVQLQLVAQSVSGRPIAGIHAMVNGVPVYGSKGMPFEGSHTQINIQINVPLVNGKNNIQVFAFDSGGFISSSENVSVVAAYNAPIPVLHFIGIGIDKFANSNYNLQYSTKDIRDLCLKLEEKYGANIHIDTLFNENVTITNIRALKEKLMQSKENDKIIISYSGHGLLSTSFDYYLSTYDVNFKKPEDLGLPYEVLENLLDSIPARKKLLLIDACHSGEVDKEDAMTLHRKADSLGLSQPRGSALLVDYTEQRVGLKNSFELMQSLFVNVGRSTGATIISAAAGNQFALERGDLRNGVFTYCILEAMENYPSLKVSELKKIVGERVEELTNGMQRPTSRNETIAADWEVW
jgi:hypothetical protein